MKAGKDEVDGKITPEEHKAHIERTRKTFIEKAERPTYTMYDFEADVHSLTHKPNHVDADVLTIGDTHDYNDCKHDTFTYSGYDVVDQVCSWLFTSKHSHSTIISHKQAGYDGIFILQSFWKKVMHPTIYQKR